MQKPINTKSPFRFGLGAIFIAAMLVAVVTVPQTVAGPVCLTLAFLATAFYLAHQESRPR